MTKTICFSSLIVAAVSASAAAQPAPADSAQPYDEIVVVATRSPQTLDRIGNAVTVLDSAQIAASQAIDVATLLAGTPGVTFSRAGGPGETTSVFIRGADSDQTVIVIDGIRLTDPTSPAGNFDFAHLLVGDAGRIEILRGPQSTLWGSDAMGGVVNIVTASPTGPFSVDAQAEGGSRGTAYVRAGLGGLSDLVDWRLAGGYFTTDGIPALDSRLGGTIKDGYHNGALSGTALIHVTDTVSLDLRGYFIHDRNDFDGYPPPNYVLSNTHDYGVSDEYILYAGVNVDLWDGRFKNRVAFQYTDVELGNFNITLPVVTTFLSTGRTRRLEYQGTLQIADGYRAVFGAESQKSTMSTASPTEFDPNPAPTTGRDEINSLYAQVQATPLEGLTFTGGLRWDDQNVFGSHTTGQVAIAWSPDGDQTILRASWGQGFKAPSLYQLFSPYGNTSLRPQQDDGWDAGVERRLLEDKVTLRATYFSRDTTDVIDFVSCFTTPAPRCATEPLGFYDNIDRAEADGVELEANAELFQDLTVAANYTHVRSINKSADSPDYNKYLARRPENAANASVTYLWPFGLSTTVAVRYAGHSFDDPANTVKLGAYTLVDLRASYQLTDRVEVYGRIEDLLDRHYETAYGYGQLGFGAFAGFRVRY